MAKRMMQLCFCLVLAIVVVYVTSLSKLEYAFMKDDARMDQVSLLRQELKGVNEKPHTIYRVYNEGTYIGALNNYAKVESFLEEAYLQEYKKEFPNSKCGLLDSIVVSKEQTYLNYEDIDDSIIQYIKDNGLVSVEATAVSFLNDGKVYAEIFVKNEEMYEEAMYEYLSYFISPTDLQLLNNGQETPQLKTYGSRAIGIQIVEDITMHEAYASVDEILVTKDEILEYLKYGDNTERKYYTCVQNDTVAGVGAKNFGLSATQIMNINKDKIQSVDQILEEGLELCVTYFTPPLDVIVSTEHMKKEPIYFDAIYQEDATLRQGLSEVVQAGRDGSKNALYEEKWENGILVSGRLLSSVDTMQAVSEVIKVGSLEIPGYGTGTFRWPVDNPYISNGWLGYPGHRAIDIQNAYNKYGSIYASDRGVVEKNSYDPISGNYVVINHNNGYKTYYGHMNVPSPIPIGTNVDKGDFIGQLGMTGRATGPHTHFFIEKDGVHLNPCEGFIECYGQVKR